MASGLEAPVMGVGSVYTLRDGNTVVLRELRNEDREMLERFVDQLSEDTIYFRFLASGINREVLIDQLSPRPGAVILVAVKDRAIVGHVAYFKSQAEAAEIGLLILDSYQGKGLGTRLIESIAREANSDGVTVFEAIIDWNNTRMIKMVRGMGFPTSEKVEPDLIRIRFPTSIDPETINEFQESWVFRPDSP
jgi:acetyltransferase